MDLNEYQKQANKTFKISGDPFADELRLAFGVVGEAGEIAEKYKKLLRGDDGFDEKTLDAFALNVAYELGDVLWYVATLAKHLDYELEDIAKLNIDKLNARLKKGTIKGKGDKR